MKTDKISILEYELPDLNRWCKENKKEIVNIKILKDKSLKAFVKNII